MLQIQILSNIEVILLSIVNEKPSYAYEIDKIIDQRGMRNWVKIGVASIYQVLKKLEDKKLVYSKKEKEGKMPDRKRYYITRQGKTALAETSKRLLAGFEWYYLDLNIGLETSDLLNSGEIIDCLNKRLVTVKKNIRRLESIYSFYSESKESSYKSKAVAMSLLCFRKAEEDFLNQTIKELSSNTYE
jgi:DNA-binding PadR family transcriptional regulator